MWPPPADGDDDAAAARAASPAWHIAIDVNARACSATRRTAAANRVSAHVDVVQGDLAGPIEARATTPPPRDDFSRRHARLRRARRTRVIAADRAARENDESAHTHQKWLGARERTETGVCPGARSTTAAERGSLPVRSLVERDGRTRWGPSRFPHPL